MIKYLNNTLPTRKNLYKWSLSDSPSCSFCLHPETLQHVVSSCKSYLEDGRYTWRHNSVLLHIANSFSSLQRCRLFVDLPSFPSPSLITSDSLRPDFALISPDNTLHILELTVGFETNIEVSNKCKAMKYDPLIQDLRSQYRNTTFINHKSCEDLFSNLLMMQGTLFRFGITKKIQVASGCTYGITSSMPMSAASANVNAVQCVLCKSKFTSQQYLDVHVHWKHKESALVSKEAVNRLYMSSIHPVYLVGIEHQWRLVVFFAGGARLQKTGCGRKYRWEPHPKSDIG